MTPERATAALAALTAALTVALAPAPDAAVRAAVEDRAVRTVSLADGQALSLAASVGSVRVTGDASRDDVRIEIVRRAPAADGLAAMPVEVEERDGGVRIDVTQRDHAADPARRVEVAILAPPTARIGPITLDEGTLTVRGVERAICGVVARGDISAADVAGEVRLETTIGSIDVRRARATDGGVIRLRTFNGDVTLGLSGPLRDTRVLALALNGTIRSSLPLAMKDGWGPRWGEASIGAATRVVSIDVVTGTIRVDVS
ncbi:MAG: hypothetical protein AB7O28_11645 [Vicinamibacterales bacterium]